MCYYCFCFIRRNNVKVLWELFYWIPSINSNNISYIWNQQSMDMSIPCYHIESISNRTRIYTVQIFFFLTIWPTFSLHRKFNILSWSQIQTISIVQQFLGYDLWHYNRGYLLGIIKIVWHKFKIISLINSRVFVYAIIRMFLHYLDCWHLRKYYFSFDIHLKLYAICKMFNVNIPKTCNNFWVFCWCV